MTGEKNTLKHMKTYFHLCLLKEHRNHKARIEKKRTVHKVNIQYVKIFKSPFENIVF